MVAKFHEKIRDSVHLGFVVHYIYFFTYWPEGGPCDRWITAECWGTSCGQLADITWRDQCLCSFRSPMFDRLTPRGVDHGSEGFWTSDPLKIWWKGQSMFWPPSHTFSFKTAVRQLCEFHIMKNERIVSKMEGKTITFLSKSFFYCCCYLHWWNTNKYKYKTIFSRLLK